MTALTLEELHYLHVFDGGNLLVRDPELNFLSIPP